MHPITRAAYRLSVSGMRCAPGSTAVVWRGAVTRLVLAITSMPDQLAEIGNARACSVPEWVPKVGVRIPEPTGVLVQAGS